MAAVDRAARRAFLLCDDILRKIASPLNLNLGDWPDPASLRDPMHNFADDLHSKDDAALWSGGVKHGRISVVRGGKFSRLTA